MEKEERVLPPDSDQAWEASFKTPCLIKEENEIVKSKPIFRLRVYHIDTKENKSINDSCVSINTN